MSKLLKSKVLAWCAFTLIILVFALTFRMREVWWAFFDIFFAFMMAFCHLAATYIGSLLPPAGRKLDIFAVVFGILAVAALIGENIAYDIIF